MFSGLRVEIFSQNLSDTVVLSPGAGEVGEEARRGCGCAAGTAGVSNCAFTVNGFTPALESKGGELPLARPELAPAVSCAPSVLPARPSPLAAIS